MFSRITPDKINKWKNKKKINKLISAINHPNDDISNMSIDALNEVDGTEAVMDLLKVLEEGKTKDRIGAARGLSRLGDKRAVPALINALSNDEASVKVQAAKALGHIKDPQAVNALITTLNDQSSEVLHDQIVNALVSIGDPSVDLLLEAFDTHTALHVRKHALLALGRIGSANALPSLIKSMKDPNPDIREAAEKALYNIGKHDINGMIKLLNDPETMIGAIRILGHTGDIKTIDPLLKSLNHDNPEIVAEVIQALGRLGGEITIQPLSDLLSDERYKDIRADGAASKEEQVNINKRNEQNRRIRRHIVRALGQNGSLNVADVIIEALADPYTRHEAIECIIQLGENTINKALRQDEWIADDLLHALRKEKTAKNKELIDIIETWKNNY